MINGAFRGIASGASAAGGGGGSGTDLLTLNAALSGTAGYHYWDFAGSFLGSFIFDDTTGAHPSSYTNWQRLGPGVTSDRIFATTQLGTVWFGEYPIPTLSASLDQNDWPLVAPVQTHRSAYADAPTPITWDEPRIGGLYYYPTDNDLYVTIVDSYGDVAGEPNTVLYTTGDNIATSSVTGIYDNGAGRHAHGGMIPIPTAFQADLGGTHMIVSGGIMSIDSSTTNGISVYVLPTPSSTSAIEAMDFPLGNDMGYLDPDIGDPMEPDTSQLWNHVACASGAFIYPNTRTLVVLGINFELSLPGNHVIYKPQVNDIGEVPDGHAPYLHDSYIKYYWLIDIDDLIATVDDPVTNPPHMILPYEYGELPDFGIGGWQQKLTGASFDPRDNRLTISCMYGATPRLGSSPSLHCFEIV